MSVMRTRIIQIGNSQGLRIPKLILEQLGLGEEVELEVQQEQLVIRPVRIARQGWAEQFQLMAARGDDQPLDGDMPGFTTWDDEEWEWT